MFKLLNLLAFLLLVTRCGQQSGGVNREIVPAPSVNSSYAGLAFTAIDINPQIDSSRLYYYDFAVGEIREVTDLVSGDPLAYWDGTELLVFIRRSNPPSVMRIDPGSSDEPSSSFELSDLNPGDPVAAVHVATNKKILATPFTGGLYALDMDKEELSRLDTDLQFDVPSDLRPTALYKSGARLFLTHRTHSNNQLDNAAEGNGLVFRLTVETDASLSGDTTPIAGSELATTNPVGIYKTGSQNMTVVGLCIEDFSACKAGASKVSGTTTTTLKTFNQSSLGYELWNQIVDGPGDYVYAHVRDISEGTLHVIKLNVKTGDATVVHDFSGERLFGIMYDDSSKTLFVGGAADINGELYVYRNESLVEMIEINFMPYNGALIRK